MTDDRRSFLRRVGAAGLALVVAPATSLGARLIGQESGNRQQQQQTQQTTQQQTQQLQAQQQQQQQSQPRPRGSEFVFARLRYDSGDWDYNPKVCANVLDSVIQYTKIPVHQQEVVITADSTELTAFPFLFMTGHKLVRFSQKERDGLRSYVAAGGLLFSDDCNHDVEGLYAKSFEAEMAKVFPSADVLPKIPNNHSLYRSFFHFPEGPPQTSHELNGWGDDVVHDYLRGVEHRGRLGVIYSNKDYGCEWDYDWRNKRFRAKDNTQFAVNLVVYSLT